MFCKKCGKEINEDELFCSGCGAKLNSDSSDKKNNIIRFKLIIVSLICIVIIIGLLLILQHKSQISPIDNVSNRIYSEAMEYLDEMEDESVKTEILTLIKKNPDLKMMEISVNLKGYKVELYIGKNPSSSEILLKRIIERIWQYKCVFFAYEIMIDEYDKYNNDDIEQAMYLAKGILSERETLVDNAIYQLRNAKSYEDLKDIDMLLDEIFVEE